MSPLHTHTLDSYSHSGVAFFAVIVAVLPEPDASRLLLDDGLGESEPVGPCSKKDDLLEGSNGAATPRRSSRNKTSASQFPEPASNASDSRFVECCML
jgi:hypothetical protein